MERIPLMGDVIPLRNNLKTYLMHSDNEVERKLQRITPILDAAAEDFYRFYQNGQLYEAEEYRNKLQGLFDSLLEVFDKDLNKEVL